MIIKIDTDKLANIGDFIQDMPYPKVIDTLYRWKSEIAAAMLQAQMDEWMEQVAPTITITAPLPEPYSVKPEAQSISHDAFKVMKTGFNGGDES